MKSGYISIIGKPNSGKSTLLNKILGEELAIVTPKPQTTRQKIVGIHNTPGAQMIFLDTPGYHESTKALNQFMMGEVKAAIKDADIVCLVVDVTEKICHCEERSDAAIQCDSPAFPPFEKGGLGGILKKTIVAINKLDTVLDRPWGEVLDQYKELYKGSDVLGISAKTGHGVDELVAKFAEALPEGEPFYPDDIYTEHPVRFLVAEIIREQTLNLLHQELPYSIAVEVEAYKEEPKIHRIEAAIIVDKESQKGMVIGKGGQMIKRIGELARSKIEILVGTKVFLKLFVKVEKNWTKDPSAIKRMFG